MFPFDFQEPISENELNERLAYLVYALGSPLILRRAFKRATDCPSMNLNDLYKELVATFNEELADDLNFVRGQGVLWLGGLPLTRRSKNGDIESIQKLKVQWESGNIQDVMRPTGIKPHYLPLTRYV
jgi:hypothetical protein